MFSPVRPKILNEPQAQSLEPEGIKATAFEELVRGENFIEHKWYRLIHLSDTRNSACDFHR